MSEDVTVADVGQHYLEMEKLLMLDADRGFMTRRFIRTFANVVVGTNGDPIFGVLQQDAEKDA